jgi:hypothetical protein
MPQVADDPGKASCATRAATGFNNRADHLGT